MVHLPPVLVLFLISAVAGQSSVYKASINYSDWANASLDCEADVASCQGLWWLRTNGSYPHWTTAGPSASANTSFYGSRVSVYGVFSPLGATVNVSLDGQWTVVDTSRPEVVHPAPIFQQNWLDPEVEHTLQVQYVNTTTVNGKARTLSLTFIEYELQDKLTSVISGRSNNNTGESVGPDQEKEKRLPIAAIIQGVMGALVILPAAAIMLFSVLRHRRGSHNQEDQWDRNYLDDGADDAQPLFQEHLQSGVSSRRSSTGSVLGALPNMAALRMDSTSLSLRSLPRSTTPQQRLQPVRERSSSRGSTVAST